MNTNYGIEHKPRDEPAAASPAGAVGGFSRLWWLYQMLGLNPEQALAAARADVGCGMAEDSGLGMVK